MHVCNHFLLEFEEMHQVLFLLIFHMDLTPSTWEFCVNATSLSRQTSHLFLQSLDRWMILPDLPAHAFSPNTRFILDPLSCAPTQYYSQYPDFYLSPNPQAFPWHIQLFMQLDLSPHFMFVQEAHSVHQPSPICLSDSFHPSHFQHICPTYLNNVPSAPTCSFHVRIRAKKMNSHAKISLQKHQQCGRSSHYLLFKTHQSYRNVCQWELPRRSIGPKI